MDPTGPTKTDYVCAVHCGDRHSDSLILTHLLFSQLNAPKRRGSKNGKFAEI